MRAFDGDSEQGLLQPPHQDAGEKEMREKIEHILRTCFTSEARERIKRIGVVKPQKADEIQMKVINEIQTHRMRVPVTDEALIQFLSAGQETQESESVRKINIVRKGFSDEF